MSGSFEIKNEKIKFIVPYNKDFVATIKEIPGRRYNPEDKTWTCPVNIVTSGTIKHLIEKYGLKQESAEFNPKIFVELEDEIKRIKTDVLQCFDSLGLKEKPRAYQFEGIAYYLATKKCIDGSEMGVGKTFTAIFTAEIAYTFPCLVVVPASVKLNWEMQWKKVNPERKVCIYKKDEAEAKEADVVIMTYGDLGVKEEKEDGKAAVKIKHPVLTKIPWVGMILDEAQNLKNAKSVRSKAVKKLSKKVPYVFMLTGTLIMNRPSELISPLGILGQFSNLFNNWEDFVYKYCGAYATNFGVNISGASNILDLHNLLKKACYFRFEKRDVLKDLPPVQETLFKIQIDNKKEYLSAKNNLINFIQRTQGLEKATLAEQAEGLALLNTLRTLASKGKLNQIIEWLDNYKEVSDEKLVIFGVSSAHLNYLSKHYKAKLIDGKVKAEKRQKIVDEFQTNKDPFLFMNILAGGVGIDGLQKVCWNMLVYELPWRPTDLDQATSRLDRSEQKHPVSISFLLAEDTIDIDQWTLLEDKRVVTEGVNRGFEVEEKKFLKDLYASYLDS